MAFDRFLIAPLNTGLQTDIKSWLTPDDAFDYLQNAYVFRGRVRKRFGSILMGSTQLNSRLRASLSSGGAGVGITDVTGAAAGNVRTILADASLPVGMGQMFSIGNDFYTVISNAAGVQAMLATTGSGTFNVTTSDFTITGGPALTAIIFYPAFPVTGIEQYLTGAVNNHPTYAFDTRYAYTFSGGSWGRSGAAIWHGADYQLFWVSNWQGVAGTPVLFVTNFNATVGTGPYPAATDDPIWTFDGTTWTARLGSTASGFFFLPSAANARVQSQFVQTARIIVPFKNRLILLNTIENDNSNYGVTPGTGVTTAYVNRCRYSINGSPFALNAWYEPNTQDSAGNIAAGAGFIDAATEEQIITAEFVKDRLIVYFERSTWELAYTGNEILPFIWNKLNTELGSQSTFSVIPFDKDALAIGNSGIHACNGSNVVRVDQKIPTTVFEFRTENNAELRTVGIRDYYVETSYWTYVSDTEDTTQTFPNRVLVYNYKNGSWAMNDDCFTFFGYFEQQDDTTWASSAPLKWFQANQTWISGVLQANQRQILGGTPEGFMLRINTDVARNAPSMYITNMSIAATGIITLTIIDHNLTAVPTQFPNDNDFILIENVVADAPTMAYLNGTIFPVFSVVDADTITINTFGGLVAGTYAGAGTCARVSNVQITTKRFNPYVERGKNVYLARIDFGVQATETGAITVDYYPSSSDVSMLQGGVASGSIMGNSILETYPYPAALYPLEQFQSLLWHPIYFQSSGEFIQIALYFSADQMINPNVSLSEFEIEGMVLHTAPTSERLQ